MPDKKKDKKSKKSRDESFLTQDFGKSKKKKGRFFLIDYENVHSAGLNGIHLLEKNDVVIVFYSIHADKISFDSLKPVLATAAEVRYGNLNTYGKNALDFQLSTYVGYLIGRNPKLEIYIVSQDMGYKNVDEFWRKQGVNIHLIPKISEIGQEGIETKRQKIHKALQTLKMSSEDLDFLEDVIITHLRKNDLTDLEIKTKINQILCHKFGGEVTREVFKVIRPFMK